MTNDDRPAPSDVESYLEEIERDGWSVEDYSASYGSDDPVTVTVELEWGWTPAVLDSETQRDLAKAVKHAIKETGNEGGGAHVDVVVEYVAENVDAPPEAIEATVETLKEKGEIYQPNKDHLRAI